VTKPTALWSPHPGSQTLFLACPVFEALLEGTRGGGKPDALIMSFAQYCGRGFGTHWRGILFRLTYPQLADVVAKTQRWFFPIFPGIRFNASDYVWTWPTGEQLYLRYGQSEDDYWHYHGHEYPWMGFEELTNWRTLAFYEAMFTTCRSSHPNMPRLVRATCNPYGVGHSAVKARFQIGHTPAGTVIHLPNQRARVRIHSTLSENTHLLKADSDYLPTLQAIQDVNRRRAWLEGSWDIHIGAFLETVWQPAQHVIKPFPIPATWRVWKAMDWGYARPYAVYWFALDPDGVTYLWRELYGDGGKANTGTREDAATVAQKIQVIEAHDKRLGYDYHQNLADPSIFSQIGANRSIGQIFRDHGTAWQPAWNGPRSRVNGAQEIIRLLCANQLKVFSTCIHWLRTVPGLPSDPNHPEDVDSDAEDHAWDATRYGVMRRRAVPAVNPSPTAPGTADYHYENETFRLPI